MLKFDKHQSEKIKSIIEARSIPIPECGCWVWEWSTQKRGYGDFRAFGKTHYLAHRASYAAYKGEIPDGLHVMHKCDNRSCCNPDHLTLGTNQDNIQDSVNKGRRKGITRNRPSGLVYRGAKEGIDKRIVLTSSQIELAKEILNDGKSISYASKVIGVKYMTLYARLKNAR